MKKIFIQRVKMMRRAVVGLNRYAVRQLSSNVDARRPSGAVIGVGFFAENHLKAWDELRVPIKAISDVDPARLKTVRLASPHARVR